MKIQEKQRFQRALILSTLLHVMIVGLFYYNLPNVFEKPPKEKEALTFEVVPVKAIANIKTENKSKQKEKIVKKSKQVKTSKPDTQTQDPLSQNSIAKKEAPKKEIVLKKQKVTPKKAKEIVPKKQKAKPKKTEVQKQEEDRIDFILKNLDIQSEGTDAKTPTKSHEATEQSNKIARGGEYDEELTLSISEELHIKKLIKDNWIPPLEFEYSQGVNLQISLELDKTGKIVNFYSKGKTCPPSSSDLCVLLKESVLRAIKKLGTIDKLLPERFNAWKEFTLNFDPEFFN